MRVIMREQYQSVTQVGQPQKRLRSPGHFASWRQSPALAAELSRGPSQASYHELGHGRINPSFFDLWPPFEVFAQAPRTVQPAKSPFNDPAPRQDLETAEVITALDNTECPTAQGLQPVAQFWSGVTAVGPDQGQAWKTVSDFLEDQSRPVSVLYIRRMDQHKQQQPQCIHDHMPLAPGHLWWTPLSRHKKGLG